jgi:SAM-dependent methyltransferase
LAAFFYGLDERIPHVHGHRFNLFSLAYAEHVEESFESSGFSVLVDEQHAARGQLNISYVKQNYLEFEAEDRLDLAMIIMCDFCALSPTHRRAILSKFHTILKPGGSVLLDVYSLAAFDQREEVATYEVNQRNGFWSPNKYYGFLNTFKYNQEKVVLDKYTTIELDLTRTVYNWLQYFASEDLEREFIEDGFYIKSLYSDVRGNRI